MTIRHPATWPLLIALLACALAAPCEAGDAGSAAAVDEAGVLKAHAAIRAAALAGSVDRLAALLHADLTLSHAGIRQSKTEWLEAIRSGELRYQAIEDTIHRLRLYGKTAVVTGQRALRLVWGGKEFSPRLQYTAVYVSGSGGWLLAAYHSDELRQPPEGQPPRVTPGP